MVGTITRAIKMYVHDEDQRDWDGHAERLVFALNTSYDRTREETPFFLIQGWNPRTTIETVIPKTVPGIASTNPRSWRTAIQRQYTYARLAANVLLNEAMADRVTRTNEVAHDLSAIQAGSHVWLFFNRVKEGYARKLAHLWHGPFRVAERVGEYMLKLEMPNADYKFFPMVHVERVKLRREFADRPDVDLTLPDGSARLDFDEALLPEDSWIPDTSNDEYEVEEVYDRRSVKRTRHGRRIREYLVRWKGDYPVDWIAEDALNCGGLIHDYEMGVKARNRLNVVVSDEVAGQDEVDPPGRGSDRL